MATAVRHASSGAARTDRHWLVPHAALEVASDKVQRTQYPGTVATATAGSPLSMAIPDGVGIRSPRKAPFVSYDIAEYEYPLQRSLVLLSTCASSSALNTAATPYVVPGG